MEVASRPPFELGWSNSAPGASVSVRSALPTIPEFQHHSPFPVPKKRHKRQTAERARSLALKSARHGVKSRVWSKSKHSSASVPQKMAPLNLVHRQVLSNLEPEGAPSTSTAQLCTIILSIPTTLETSAVTRDLLTLSVLVSLAVQELTLSVPADTGEPAVLGTCQPHVSLTTPPPGVSTFPWILSQEYC